MLLHCQKRLRFRNGRRSFRRSQQSTDSSKTERIKSHFGNRCIFRPMHPCSQTLTLDNACKPKSQSTDRRDLTGGEIRRTDKVPARSLWVVTCISSESRSSSLTTSGATTMWLRHELSGPTEAEIKKNGWRMGTTTSLRSSGVLSPTLGQTFRPTAGRTNMVPRLWSPILSIQVQGLPTISCGTPSPRLRCRTRLTSVPCFSHSHSPIPTAPFTSTRARGLNLLPAAPSRDNEPPESIKVDFLATDPVNYSSDCVHVQDTSLMTLSGHCLKRSTSHVQHSLL